MKTMGRRTIAVHLLLFLVTFAAQASDGVRPVFAFVGIHDEAGHFTTAEIRVLENRLTSELVSIADREGFSITIPSNRDEILQFLVDDPADTPPGSLSRHVSAYAVVGGEIGRRADSITIELRSVRVEDDALLAVFNAPFDSIQSALGTVVEIVAGAVGPAIPSIADENRVTPPAGETDVAVREEIALEDLIGEWSGDQGLTTVEVFPDGSAVASLNGVGTMQLRITIDGNVVRAVQDEPNAPRMYMTSFPYTVAVQMVDIARPVQWEFTLSENGTTLHGIKDTTFFQISRGRVVWADNTYSREAVWTRLE